MRADLDNFIEAEDGPRGRVYAYTDKPVYFIETEDGRRDVIVGSQITRVVTHWQEAMHGECDCVPDLGPSHCHRCSAEHAGRIVVWAEAPCRVISYTIATTRDQLAGAILRIGHRSQVAPMTPEQVADALLAELGTRS